MTSRYFAYDSRQARAVSEERTVRTLRGKIIVELEDLKGIGKTHPIVRFVGADNGQLNFKSSFKRWYGSPNSSDSLANFLIDLRRVYRGDKPETQWRRVGKRVRRKK